VATPDQALAPARVAARADRRNANRRSAATTPVAPPLLICGATGTLGQALARACAHRDIAHVLTDRAALDLADEATIGPRAGRALALGGHHAAGWCATTTRRIRRRHAGGRTPMARLPWRACARERDIPTVNFSSDLSLTEPRRLCGKRRAKTR
jgi:dTDP-4-dehydrorhamnose reductase